MKKTILYSYRMRCDTGFAPNPYFGILTLATCMPCIRNNARINRELNNGNEVWIAGWTGKNLAQSLHLIWLGKVSKQIPLAEYWEKYPQKRPISDTNVALKGSCHGCGGNVITPMDKDKGCGSTQSVGFAPSFYGDNIYCPDTNAPLGFVQMDNPFHFGNNVEEDLKGKNAILCEEFFYFGHEMASLLIPEQLMPAIPLNQTRYGSTTLNDKAQRFIDYVKAQPCLISHLNPMPKK